MKKILVLIVFASIGAGCYFIFDRYRSNSNSTIPLPYVFHNTVYKDINIEKAPIVIIGDRLGYKLASFKNYMASRISTNLSKQIKIISLAQKGEGLHRTLKKIKNLKRLPLVTIYLGGSEETYEQRFKSKDINTITKNFKLYEDDRTKTALMIFPSLAKFIYTPVDYKKYIKSITPDENEYSDFLVQQRNMIHFKLYEQELNELFSYIKEHGSYLYALTQPINYSVPPKKSCSNSLDEITKKRFDEAIELVKKKDFKKAYSVSKDLVLIANTNAKIFYVHGQIASSLGFNKEAQKALQMGVALDCKQWRGSPIYNQILKKVGRKNEVLVFDFDKLLIKEKQKNIVFQDDVYPQNLYYERVVNILSDRIRRLLKL